MKLKLCALCIILLPLYLTASVSLFDKIEEIKVGLDGYHIGQHLSKEQQNMATKHRHPAKVKGTYKFQDKDTFVIADEKTHRVVLIYKAFKQLGQTKIKELISRSIGRFEEPTTVAHNKAIYWFYKQNGSKISLNDFEAWRRSSKSKSSLQNAYPSAKELIMKKQKPIQARSELGNLVSVKLNFSKAFNNQDPMTYIDAYLIISSESLIKNNYNIASHL